MEVNASWDQLFSFLREFEVGEGSYNVVEERLPSFVRQLIWYDDKLATSSGGLVHYTSWERMLRLFDVKKGKSPMLRMYNYESANDPEEGSIKPPEWRALEKKAKSLLDKYDPEGSEERNRGGSTYGCSFSTNGLGVEDDLMFWRLYGNDGEGCSLKLGSVPMGMYRVRYRSQKGKRTRPEMREDRAVADRMNRLLEIGTETIDRMPVSSRKPMGKSIARLLGQVLDGYSHLVKNRAYEHEQEWRMIRVMPEREDVKYDVGTDRVVRRYVEGGKMANLFTSFSTITIGPRVPNSGAAREYIEAKARKSGMKYTRVGVSSKRYQRIRPSEVIAAGPG